jgi:hypothetical protein
VLIVALASAISGGLMPEIAKAVALGERRFDRARLADMLFNAGVFALIGGIIGDQWFKLMGHLFGDGGGWLTVAKKVAADQFVLTPFFNLPIICFCFHLRQVNWKPSVVIASLSPAWYRDRAVVLLIMCWCYWIPMCCLMYTLPTKLVFCFAMFAQAAWSILMVFAANQTKSQSNVERGESSDSGLKAGAHIAPVPAARVA